MSTHPEVADDDEVTIIEAHRRRMPALGPYLTELWGRRRFAVRLARSELKAQHYNSVFGQLWAVLNPLLLAGVFFLIFGVVLGAERGQPDYLAALLSGLFAFYYTRNALSFGAKSIVGGGGLILNSAFPRAMLPLSAVISAFLTYLPMLVVYAMFHVIGGYPVTAALVIVPVIVAIQTVLNLGMALGFAALTVYFRDTSSFLPYFLRIWLYVSPVVYSVEQVPERLRPLLALNPLFPLLDAWHSVLLEGRFPPASQVAYAAAWAIGAVLLGGWFFISREREFAVRI